MSIHYQLFEEANGDIAKKLQFLAEYILSQEDASGVSEAALLNEAATEIGRLRYLCAKEGVNYERS